MQYRHRDALRKRFSPRTPAHRRWNRWLPRILILSLIASPGPVPASGIAAAGSGDQRPGIDQANNGTPVVNIANPNGKGLSHNLYQQFNVGGAGVILNNSRQVTDTELAGYIEGNPNLRSGSARLILNEVVNANPSSLNGYIEVGGQAADVVVANPWGISCDGCGFINTHRATLTTGVPQLHNGFLQGFAVDGGQVRIEGDGLNAENLDRFDIIARSVELSAALYGNHLNIVTGAQDVDAETLAIANERGGSDVPEFAISSSALGGIYGDRIELIANEHGVGVNLDAPVAAQNGDFILTANGDVRYSRVAATGDIHLEAGEHEVLGQGRLYADGNASVSAGQVVNEGMMAAGQLLELDADRLDNAGTVGAMNQLSVRAADIHNRRGGALLAAGPDLLTGDMALYTERMLNEGDIYAAQGLEIAGDDGGTPAERIVNSSGLIEAGADLTIDADTVINKRTVLEHEDVLQEGVLTYYCTDCSGDHLGVSYKMDETYQRALTDDSGSAFLVSGGDLRISGNSLENHHSNIISYGGIDLDVSSVLNQGLNTGEYHRISTFWRHGNGSFHESLVLRTNGVKDYNDHNYPHGAEYWGSGSNRDREYMRLYPDRVNPDYPGDFIQREDTFFTLYNFNETFTYVDSEEGLADANIVAADNIHIRDGADIVNSVDDSDRVDAGLGESLRGQFGESAGNEAGEALANVRGGLFDFADANHPYLVETNPLFDSLDGFYGSEYLLRRLGWDPDGTLRLLGDAFYEQRLIREKIVEETGRVFLDEQYADANEQYKALLDQGIHAAEEMGLAIGVALSPSQINRLTEDIVWMVEKEVAGETVLAPELYLAPATATTDHDGALIAAGGDISNQGGSVHNSGYIEADGSIDLQLNDEGFTNRGGTVSAGEALTIETGGDIVNLSGRLQADMLALSAGGDITNERWHERLELGVGGNQDWETRHGRAATIEGTQSFSLDAEGNIEVKASEIKGGEGSLSAGGDINVGTVALESGRKGHFGSGQLNQSKVEHLGSTLSSTLDLLIEAEKNINIIGSDVAAEQTLAVSAGEDLNVLAATNSSRYDFRARHDGETTIRKRRRVRQQQSTLSGGTDLALSSGGNMAVVAGDLEAGKDLSLMSQGNLALLAAKDSDYSYTYDEDDKWYGSKTKISESYSEEVVSTELSAGNNVLINADVTAGGGIVAYQEAEGDVLLQGAKVDSGGQFVGYAGNDFNITAAESSSYSHSETRRSYSGLAAGVAGVGVGLLETAMPGSSLGIELEVKGDEAHGRGNTRLTETAINSDGGTTVLAGRHVNVVASDIEAAIPEEGETGPDEQQNFAALGLGDITMAAGLDPEQEEGAINVIGARESSYSYAHESKLDLNVDFGGGKMSLARQHDTFSSSESQTWVGSNIRGGGNVHLDSATDINLVGSNLIANGNLSLASGGDINVLTGSNIHREEQSDTFREFKVEATASGNSAELFAGYEENRHTALSEDRVAVAGNLMGANVNVSSDRDINLVGSNITAIGFEGDEEGKTGNITLNAERDVNTLAAVSESTQSVIDERFRSGFAIGASENLSNASESLRRLGDADGGLNTASAGLQAIDAVSATQRPGSWSVGFVAEYAKSESDVSFSQSVVSEIEADNDLIISSGRNQHHQGTQASAGNALVLTSGEDITIESAQSRQSHSGGSHQASTEIGLSSGVGLGGTVSAGYSKTRGEDVYQQNAGFAAEEVSIEAGGDMTLSGAVVRGESLSADIQGNLSIESRQDTGYVRGESAQASVSVGTKGASVSLGGSHAKGDKAWVTEQTALLGGESADVYVGGHTQLDGGILGTESGEDFKLNTGSLGYSDIKDYDHFESSQFNIGLSVSQESASRATEPSDASEAQRQQGGVDTNSAAGGYEASFHEQSTLATLTPGDITIRNQDQNAEINLEGLNRDLDAAQITTRDEEEDYDLYVSGSSIKGATKIATQSPKETARDVLMGMRAGATDFSNMLSAAKVATERGNILGIADYHHKSRLYTDATAQFVRDNPDLASIIANGESADVDIFQVAAQTYIDYLAKAMGQDKSAILNVLIDTAPAGSGGVAKVLASGAYHDASKTIFTNFGSPSLGISNSAQTINTLGHELTHFADSGLGEDESEYFGNVAADAWLTYSTWERVPGAKLYESNDNNADYQWIEKNRFNPLVVENRGIYRDLMREELRFRQPHEDELNYVDHQKVAFAEKYYGIDVPELSEEQINAAHHVLNDSLLWLVSNDRRRDGGASKRGIDFLLKSEAAGRLIGETGQWMFVANHEQREDYWLNMPADHPESVALYEAVMDVRSFIIENDVDIFDKYEYREPKEEQLEIRPWGEGGYKIHMSEIIDGKLYTGWRHPCFNYQCIGNNYSNDSNTSALLVARDRRAQRQFLNVAGLATGGTGIAIRSLGYKIPAALAGSDLGVGIMDIWHQTYWYGTERGVLSAFSMFSGYGAAKMANEARLPGFVQSGMDKFTTEAIDSVIEKEMKDEK